MLASLSLKEDKEEVLTCSRYPAAKLTSYSLTKRTIAMKSFQSKTWANSERKGQEIRDKVTERCHQTEQHRLRGKVKREITQRAKT